MKHSALTMTSAHTARRFGLAALLAAGVAAAPLSSALANASITWGAVSNETGVASDVVTTGTFVDSATANSAGATVNGVTFNGVSSLSATTDSFAGSNITLNNPNVSGGGLYAPNTFIGGLGAPYSGWSANYQAMVGYGIQALDVGYGGNLTTMSLGGLTVGQNYLIQIFESPWDSNWLTTYSDGSSAVSLALTGNGVNGSATSTVTQDVTGTFTANATTETLDVTSAPGLATFSAIQVRNVTNNNGPNVPEPSDLSVAAVALIGFLAARRGKLRRFLFKD